MNELVQKRLQLHAQVDQYMAQLADLLPSIQQAANNRASSNNPDDLMLCACANMVVAILQLQRTDAIMRQRGLIE